MDQVTFEIKSLLSFKLEMVTYPELTSPKHWVQKGLGILKQYAPKVLHFLSREHILAKLNKCSIILETEKDTDPQKVKFAFKIWLQKEKVKRLFYVIIEALLIPFTGILALLPGPNFFFYIPALLFYYHFMSLLSLRKIDVDELDITVTHT